MWRVASDAVQVLGLYLVTGRAMDIEPALSSTVPSALPALAREWPNLVLAP